MTDRDRLRKRMMIFAVVNITAVVVLIAMMPWAMRMINVLYWSERTNFGAMRILRYSTDYQIGLVVLALVIVTLLVSLAGFCVSAFRWVRAGREAGTAPEPAAGVSAVGGDKYLRQLDDQLKSGLIDKAEYRTLREKYLRMNRDR